MNQTGLLMVIIHEAKTNENGVKVSVLYENKSNQKYYTTLIRINWRKSEKDELWKIENAIN